MNPCERCGAQSPAARGNSYKLHDYCAVCGANLCTECMAKGHCGNVPALSGMADDDSDDSDV